VQHHQAGRIREAEGIYKQILAADPNNAHALHLLGVLASQVGQGEQALEFIRRAIALNPTAAPYHANLGAALATLGRYEEAIEEYHRALLLQPGLLDAHANLGVALARMGKFDAAVESLEAARQIDPKNLKILESLASALSQAGQQEKAIEILQQALALRSDFAPTHLTLGNALLKLNRADEAMAAYRAALALRPEYAEAQANLSGIICERGKLDEAIELARRSLANQPESPQAWYHLGRALHKQNRLDESAEALGRAVALRPRFAQALGELGAVLIKTGALAQAVEALRQSLEIEPAAEVNHSLGLALRAQGKFTEALAAYKKVEAFGFRDARLFNNIAEIEHRLGQYDEAIEYFQKALEIQPDFPLARWNLSIVQLLTGDYREGWAGYELRWKANSIPLPQRYSERPVWDGSDPRGRKILVDCEQAFGDSLHFVRYIPLIAQRGGKPILAAPPELRRLFQTVPCLEQIICPPQELPAFDAQCPLLSLPHLFGTTLQNVPANVPYLFADPALEERWKKRVPQDGRLKIGIVWAGSPGYKENVTRSPSLAAFGPLGAIPNTWFCSLQKGDAAREALDPPEGLQITDWTAELQDFADTAALMANLDLIIGSDTAVIHLAGGMGKPAMVLLAYVPGWPWLLEREDSPWYPTMRLFRQPKFGDWKTPMERIVKAVRTQAAKS